MLGMKLVRLIEKHSGELSQELTEQVLNSVPRQARPGGDVVDALLEDVLVELGVVGLVLVGGRGLEDGVAGLHLAWSSGWFL